MLFALLIGPFTLTAAQTLDGIWRSQGYGYVFQIQGPILKAFEVTTTTCVLGFTAKRVNRAVPEREETFRTKEKDVYFVRTGGTSDHKFLHQEDSVTDIRIDRVAKLPAVCGQPTTNTPLNNFQVFTRTWAENYISFDRRHTDWNKVVAEYRPQITSQTAPMQLYEIFEAMIKPLSDLHTYIGARELKRSTKVFWRPGTNRIIKDESFAKRGRQAFFAITNQAYLQDSPRMFCNKQLQYGHINNTTGYLRILSFGGYAGHNDLKALESALDVIFSDRNLQALVIDMRLSFGGSDELGLAIARRLATSKYLAYTVQARADSVKSDEWTPGYPVVIQPSQRPGFWGPVVELIGPITMSAAETFTQALMGRTPHVTRIGENTQGVFCDVLDRHLPNGWTFGLPNAVYRTPEGTAFDVQGIPPDIAVPVFADADVAAKKDPDMAKALQVLQETRAGQNNRS